MTDEPHPSSATNLDTNAPIKPATDPDKPDEPKVTTNEPKVTTDEPKVTTDEPKVTTDEPKVTTDEPKVTTGELPTNKEESVVPNQASDPVDKVEHKQGKKGL